MEEPPDKKVVKNKLSLRHLALIPEETRLAGNFRGSEGTAEAAQLYFIMPEMDIDEEEEVGG